MNATKIKTRRKNRIVENVWMIDLIPSKDSNTYYYPPNNSAEIIIVLEGSVERKSVGCNTTCILEKNNSYLSNIRSKGVVFTSKSKASLLIIQLNPKSQGIFSKEKLLYARDKISALNMPIQESFIWKKHIANKDVRKIFTLVDKFIVEINPKKRSLKDNTVSESINIIREKNGNVLVKELYHKMGVCKSTLEHKFNKEIGISPKEYCKIEKLNHFFSNYKELNKEMSLTELTYMSGYYDQSHLIKDFRFYLDQSPKKFLNEEKKILI